MWDAEWRSSSSGVIDIRGWVLVLRTNAGPKGKPAGKTAGCQREREVPVTLSLPAGREDQAFLAGSNVYPSFRSSIDQPPAAISFRRTSALVKSLACLAAHRFSARAVISAGASEAADFGAVARSSPSAYKARSNDV